MTKKLFLSVALLALAFGMLGAWLMSGAAPGKTEAARESAYDRVMRTQTLRCGYVVWTPFLLKDPANGKFSGLFYDYTEALGAALHLKIEWTEEEGWGDYPAALNAGRVDAMCGGSWANSARARVIDFAQPIIYQQSFAWVREGDTRFDNNIAAINDPAVSVTFVEGSTQQLIAEHDFPKARRVPLPDMTSLADTLVGLVAGKADVGLVSTEGGYQYVANNPGKVRPALGARLRIFGNSLAVAGGEERLRRMLDNATNELLASGQVDKMVAGYGKVSETWLPVAKPYSGQ